MPARSCDLGKTQGLVSKAPCSGGKTTKAFAGCFGVPAVLPPSTPNLAKQHPAASAGHARGFVGAPQCARTSTDDAQGAEMSRWDLLLQSGQPRIVPLQGLPALLRQHSCLWLPLLMLLPAWPAAEPKIASLGSSQHHLFASGRYLQAAAAVSSFLFTCPNHQKTPQQCRDPGRSLQSRGTNTSRVAGLHL